MQATEAVDEARRMLQICNACRYCEGYCAVFPAMELRRVFSNGDLSYLANLCHDCRGCYYACQYAPPHEFALNLPQALARVRLQTYEEYAWPRFCASLFRRNGTSVALLTCTCIALVLVLTMTLRAPINIGGALVGSGAFYKVIPEAVMTCAAAITLGFSTLALALGFVNFWRGTGEGTISGARTIWKAVSDVLTLRNLGGGGGGCNDRDESFSEGRRYFHHSLFYGFLLCFASTCAAAIYEHLLGRISPYPFFSVPVLLGTAGGIGLIVGTAGMIWIKITGDPTPFSKVMLGPDYALLLMLFLAAITGLMLLVLRGTEAMKALLALHLGAILSFFLMLPYSKFVHGIYRSAALLRNAMERPEASR